MVRAARPGASKRKEAADSAKQVMTIRIADDEPVTLAMNLIPMQERLIVRRATGQPLEAFLGEDKIGTDSICVFWWLGRRANGEPFLTWTDAVEQFPTDLDADKFDITVDSPDDTAVDPEAPGPDS